MTEHKQKERKGVGTLMELDGKFLILKRKDDDSFGGLWGLPAGGIEEGESPTKAAVREIFEESGFRANEKDLLFVKSYDWQSSKGYLLKFWIYRLKLDKVFEVRLDKNEHSDFRWVTPEECARQGNLVEGFYEVLQDAYGISSKQKKP